MHWLKANVEKRSSLHVLNDLGILYPPVDIVWVADQMGVGLSWVDGANWDSAVESSPDGSAKIYCNVFNHSAEKCRFEVARCLALLIKNEPGLVFRNGTRDDTKRPKDLIDALSDHLRDAAANLYALELLAPKPQVQVLAPKHNVGQLAALFAINPELMQLRLKQCGYRLDI